MRTNGFILIALGLTVASMAGTPGYLPSVGPVALRFEQIVTTAFQAKLPDLVVVSEPPANTDSHLDVVMDLPAEPPTEPAPTATTLMNDLPVVLPEALLGSATNSAPALIGPLMETNGTVTPQMFLRFFTPPQGGVSRETIVVSPPGFNPARPPTPSSTIIYSQPKP